MRIKTRFAQFFTSGSNSFSRCAATLALFSLLIILVSCQTSGSNNNGGGGAPAFTAHVTTQGNFSNGEQNATYNIVVSNTGNASTSGTVTVADPPSGFTATAIAGTGWTCTLSSLTCTRSDALAAGQSYPGIAVTGNVTSANGTPISIPLNVSGGGVSTPVTATPSVTVAAPALSITKTHTGNFNLGQQGATYTVTVGNGSTAGATNAKVTVTETVPSGETLVSMAGSGWTCPGSGGATTCDRSDALTTNASYPAITVTVNVSTAATSPQLNQVTVSGGGMTSSVSKTDSTTINLPDLSITKSHTGAFTAGTNNTFNIAVSNVSTAGSTAGTITVTDTLDSHFTFVSGTATGWTCGAASQVVTCTDPGPLAAGASATPIPLVVAVSASASGSINNTATVSTPGDSNSANNSSTDTVTFGAVDLSITKSHTANSFTAGGTGTFNIAVKNVGGSATTGAITVADTLASQFTFVSGIATGWGCSASGQVVTCTNPGPIAAGASATSIPLIVSVSASATGSISNTATVATTGDTNSANNSSTDTVTLGPDLSMAVGTVGNATNFGAGTSGIFTLTVSNVGSASTSSTVTVTDTLASQFTYKTANAFGWSCSASGQAVTCTNPGPVAPGASAVTIPLVVAVGTAASGNVSNTATVSVTGDANSSNNSATDTVNVEPQSSEPEVVSLTVPGAGVLLTTANNPGGVIYAGGSAETVTITVTSEGAGDILTPSLTLNGAACSAATCGTIPSVVTGTSSPFTLSYTPPASVTAQTTITLNVSSSTPGAFGAMVNFSVYPAGAKVVKVQGLPGGTGAQSFVADVFNDSSNLGATASLRGAGYLCPAATGGGTVCGTLTTGSTTTSGTTTSTNGTAGIPYTIVSLSYTLPASVPNSPYDRPEIFVVASADHSAVGALNFPLVPGNGTAFALTGPLNAVSRLSTALTGGPAFTLTAGLGNDPGVNKTAIWTLTANGTDCHPACGVLGTPAYIRNGNGVTSTITYTPPATLPTGAARDPMITVTGVDPNAGNGEVSDFVNFQINDGTCGTGNNGILNGQYAFLVQGGGESLGYAAFIGSFTADGNGNITAGVSDSNRTSGALASVTFTAAGSSYSVGPDGRGCITLTNSLGGFVTYRVALGSLDGSGHATQGSIIRFDDNSGAGAREQGVVLKQDPTAFSTPFSGKFVLGEQGVTGAGARLAVAGIETSDGAGHLSNFDTDAMDGLGNADTNDTTGSGTYSTTVDSTTGRGTSLVNSIDSVFYVVNSSETLTMSTDPLGGSVPIVSGILYKQTTTTYTPTSMDGKSYIFYETAIDPSNGGNFVAVGQTAVANSGTVTGEQDLNDYGTNSTQPITDTFTIAANGRVHNSNNSLILYLISNTTAFLVQGANGSGSPQPAIFGYGQQQAAGSFTNASISGQLFFGGGAASPAGPFDSGAVTLDGLGTISLNIDEASAEGDLNSGTESQTYSVSPAGKLTIAPQQGGGIVGFLVSGSSIVLMSTDTDTSAPELVVGQK